MMRKKIMSATNRGLAGSPPVPVNAREYGELRLREATRESDTRGRRFVAHSLSLEEGARARAI